MAKHNPRRQRHDPIVDYVEWSQHRYDPGYYLGGNLQPHLRKASLGPRARRLAGLLLGFFALTFAPSMVLAIGAGRLWALLFYLVLLLLIASAGIRMYRSGTSRGSSGRPGLTAPAPTRIARPLT